MKKLIAVTVLVFFGVNTTAQDSKKVIKLSEPILVTENYEVYGEKLKKMDEPISLTSLVASTNELESDQVLVKTSIAEVCEKKGCFFIAQEGEQSVRITFKDYGFFIPTDSKGKEVTIAGVFTKKVLSEEKAKHYAEDAGKESSDIIGDQVEYSIVASSIILNKEIKK